VWLYVPTTSPSSRSAPGAEASTSDSDSPSAMLARSVTWSGKLSLPRVWSRRWAKVSWMTRLSGVTLPPSTACRGVASWIASCRAGRARPTRWPAAGAVPVMRVTCGPMFSESSRRFVLDCSLERTSQALLELGCPTDSHDPFATSRALAIELRRLSLLRRKSARAMNASAASSWPTPDAGCLNDGEDPAAGAERRARLKAQHGNGNGAGQPLASKVMAWPTPRTTSGGAESAGRKQELRREESGGGDLQAQAQMWLTPHGLGGRDASGKLGGGGGGEFAKQATQWPTPTAEDSESSGNRNLPGAGNTLSHASRAHTGTWMTPTGLDVVGGAYQYDNHDRTKPRPSLVGQSRSFPLAPAPPTSGDGSSSSTPVSRRRLNPRFVSYLMGWPLIGDTGSGCSETGSSRYKQRMRSALWQLVRG